MNATSPAPVRVLAAGEFYGAIDAQWHTELVKLSVVRHAVPRAVPPHRHEHMYLSLLLTGAYREWVGDREIAYEPLTVVFHPEQLEHRDEIVAPDSTFFTAEIRPELVGDRARRHHGLASVRDLRGGPLVWTMLHLYDAVGHHHHDAVECEEPISELIDDLIGRPAPTALRPRWLRAVEDKLDAEYRTGVSLHALSTLAGVHPVHVARVFRHHHGESIRVHVHRLRVLHASRMIAAGATLAAAALDSGFCDQSHMNRVFGAVAGLTPSAFRRATRR